MTTARPESRLSDQLRALTRIVRVGRQRLAVQAGHVQPGMTGILVAIGSAGEGCHPKELAARCGLDASTISRAVAALTARGLVQRTTDLVDRRACILTLTHAGRAALADVERRQADLLTAALRGWTARDVDAFTAALARFIGDVTAYLDGTSTAPDRTSSAPAAAGAGDPSGRETPTLEAAL